MNFLKQKKFLIIFISIMIIGGLLFWLLADKISGDCSRNKWSSITIAGDKVYCDHQGRMWTRTLPEVSSWGNAIKMCENLTYAKKNDWELPDIFTLINLHYNNYYYVICNNREFIDLNSKNNWDPNVCTPSKPAGHYYWSSSEFSSKYVSEAWQLFGWDGYDPSRESYRGSPSLSLKSNSFSFRCVEKSKGNEKDRDKNCNKIRNQEERNYCYAEIAVLEQDAFICENIQEKKIEDYCYSEVAASKQNASICDYIQDKSFKDFCNWRIALLKEDQSVCEKIQNSLSKNFKGYCYAELAVLKNNLSVCDKIDGDEKVRIPYHTIKDKCYFSIAISEQKTSVCDKIQENSYRDSCYISAFQEDVLSIEQGFAVCDKIQNQNFKNTCYEMIAVAKKDSSICEKIQGGAKFNGQTAKEWCYKRTR